MLKKKAISIIVPNEHKHAVLIDVSLSLSLRFSQIEGLSVIKVKAKALIDTGANCSCISKRLASACHLECTEFKNMRSAEGSVTAPVYNVDFEISDGIDFYDVPVLEFIGGRNFDMIIGMDILQNVDIAITNANNEMMFSMQIPPASEHIDFTK